TRHRLRARTATEEPGGAHPRAGRAPAGRRTFAAHHPRPPAGHPRPPWAWPLEIAGRDRRLRHGGRWDGRLRGATNQSRGPPDFLGTHTVGSPCHALARTASRVDIPGTLAVPGRSSLWESPGGRH